MRICLCLKQVERRKCHKNRHGEYICRTCLAEGKYPSRQPIEWKTILKNVGVALGGLIAIPGLVFVASHIIAWLVATIDAPGQ